jgi:hypothetical protein
LPGFELFAYLFGPSILEFLRYLAAFSKICELSFAIPNIVLQLPQISPLLQLPQVGTEGQQE